MPSRVDCRVKGVICCHMYWSKRALRSRAAGGLWASRRVCRVSHRLQGEKVYK